MSKIIQEAVERFKPIRALLLFSGGHDSLCSAHYSANYCKLIGLPFSVYHGNTGIGIQETRDYVEVVVKQMGWALYVGYPAKGETYEDMVRKNGFPGPPAHMFMYRNLKEKPLRRYVTHSLKSGVGKRENVLLLTGIRKSESKIRMGYKDYITKEGSRVWCSPIFEWSKEDCENYMLENNLPRNSVKDKICISGECLCGAFAGKEEYAEIKSQYPEAAEEITRLHKIAIENGHPWNWASGKNEYYRKHPKNQTDMFMCIGCEEKNQQP